MLPYLWRVSPRTLRNSWVSQLSSIKPAQIGYLVARVEYFGIVTDVVVATAQGSQSSAASASVATASAPITTAQGSQSTSASASLSVGSVVDTAQGSQSSDASAVVSPFQRIAARGWLDAAIVTTHNDGLWRIVPRERGGFAAQLASTWSGASGDEVSNDAFFGPRYTYVDGIGTPNVGYANRALLPASIVEWALGAATVYNKSQFVVATGINQFAAGTATVYNSSQSIAPSGIDESAFGTANIFSTTRTVYGDGFETWAFGRPTLENLNKTIGCEGFVEWAFGTAFVQNSQRFVRPQRIDPGPFGTATIVGPRYITAGGLSDSAVGSHEVIGPRTVVASGISGSAYSNLTNVGYYVRSIAVSGIEVPVIQVSQHAEVLPGINRYVYPSSIDEPTFYEPIIGFAPLAVIECAGIDETAFGDITIDEPESPPSGTTRYVKARAIAPGSIGSHRMNPVQIRPSGISASTIGTARISNWVRYLQPSGITGVRYGTHWISNYIRYLNPPGFDMSVVWDDFGPIDLDGNRAMVRNARELISPAGLESPGMGTPILSQQC